MHRVSDGQRRRVQICLGLLKPFKVLLLDEITVDLDVVGRSNLMQYLREVSVLGAAGTGPPAQAPIPLSIHQQECETRGATVIYCTHIFDGLESWPTHLMYVANGEETRDVSEPGGIHVRCGPSLCPCDRR